MDSAGPVLLLAVVLCLSGFEFSGGLSLEVGNMEKDRVKDDRQLLQAVWDLFPLYHLELRHLVAPK